MKTHYRIVNTSWCSWYVQRWRWWWPFWCDTSFFAHRSFEDALRRARYLANPPPPYKVEITDLGPNP